jgi:hypothetical protein
MKRYEYVTAEIMTANSGNYIRFEGYGIISGYDVPLDKDGLYQIIEATGTHVKLKKYRSKKSYYLTKSRWSQSCEIYTAEEYKKLPAYFWK